MPVSRIGVDPLAVTDAYWDPSQSVMALDMEVVNKEAVDPTFSFMTVDKDGRSAWDCSSPYAMASLIGLERSVRHRFFGNDPDLRPARYRDAQQHLPNPNHYLAVAISYLFQHRPNWAPDAAIGKTSSPAP